MNIEAPKIMLSNWICFYMLLVLLAAVNYSAQLQPSEEDLFSPSEVPEDSLPVSFSDEDLSAAEQRRRSQLEEDSSEIAQAQIPSISSIGGAAAFEGDIQQSASLRRHISATREIVSGTDQSATVEGRLNFNAAIIDSAAKWPGGIIPYRLSGKFRPNARNIIATAIAEFHLNTCLRFVAANDSHPHFVYFNAEGGGCASDVGRVGGVQNVTLATARCFQDGPGIIIHELMHAIGFFHEQARYDRNEYVEIHWENIQPQMDRNFERYNTFDAALYQTYYDYHSIMHYDQLAFSKNGEPTIIPRLQDVVIGQRRKLSPIDIYEVRRHYDCPGNFELPVPEYGSKTEDCKRLSRCLTGWLDAFAKCHDEKKKYRDLNIQEMAACDVFESDVELTRLRWNLAEKHSLADCLAEQSFDCSTLLPPGEDKYITPFSAGTKQSIEQICGYADSYQTANGDCSGFVGKCKARYNFCTKCYERSQMIEIRTREIGRAEDTFDLACAGRLTTRPATTLTPAASKKPEKIFTDPVIRFDQYGTIYRLGRCLSWYDTFGGWTARLHCDDNVVPNTYCRIMGYDHATRWSNGVANHTLRLKDIQVFCPTNCASFSEIACAPYEDSMPRAWGEWAPWSICLNTAVYRNRNCLYPGACSGEHYLEKPCSSHSQPPPEHLLFENYDTECVDSNDGCAGFAAGGACQTNEEWMSQQCRLSCAVCDGPQGQKAFAMPKNPLDARYLLDGNMYWAKGPSGQVVADSFCRIQGYDHATADWQSVTVAGTKPLGVVHVYCPSHCGSFAQIVCVWYRTVNLHSCVNIEDGSIEWTLATNSENTSPWQCMEICSQLDDEIFLTSNFHYAGLQNGTKCLCGIRQNVTDSFNETQALGTDEKNELLLKDCLASKCLGSSALFCGSSANVAVYARKESPALPATSKVFGEWSVWEECETGRPTVRRQRVCLHACHLDGQDIEEKTCPT